MLFCNFDAYVLHFLESRVLRLRNDYYERLNNVNLIIDRHLMFDINTIDELGNSSLIYAFMNGHFSIAQKLMTQNANIHVKNIRGETALHFACLFCRRDNSNIVQQLIDYGAQVNAINIEGSTPLYKVCKYYNWVGMDILLKNKANIYIKNNEGSSAARIAYEVPKKANTKSWKYGINRNIRKKHDSNRYTWLKNKWMLAKQI